MRWWLISFLFVLPVSLTFSQNVFDGDTLVHKADTLHTDSLKSKEDTTKSVKGVDSVVTYASTDSIVYSLSTKTMSLYNKSEIKYRQLQLHSERIDINWNTSVMNAFGVPDTSRDSTKKKMKGLPVMKDGGEEYHGSELSYNFKSKKGRINVANTQIDQGYYHGEEIKKVAPDVLFVENGRYTTCDADDPHYYFASPKMKVIVQDKIIAEPVYLYIADVPIFALPLGVFPAHGGRRSGIIAPAIVEDQAHGRLLHHLGYYWAISDYMDINLRSDLYTRGSWGLSSDYRYALRYYFSGGVSGQYLKLISGEPSDPTGSTSESYHLNILHNQEFDPTTHMNVNFTFASNNSYLNTIDQQQALNQSITSNATISKSWEGSPNSMSVSISRTQDLQNGNISAVLPQINFNHSQSYPFRFGMTSDETSNLSWYEQIGMSYSATLSNSQAKTQRTIFGIKTNINGADTLISDNAYEQDRTQSVSQSVSFNIAPKLGYIAIVPQLSYQDQRTFSNNDIPQLGSVDSTLVFANTHDAHRTGTLSSGVGLSTRLYGILQPGIFGIAAIRHTFSPNLSFTYNKQIIGDNTLQKQMVMGLSVSNLFEMKTTPAEEGKEGDKIQLLNVNAGINYDFNADSLRFSAINLNYWTSIGSILKVDGAADFDLYKLVQTGPATFTRVNRFLLNEEGRLARLTDFRIALSTQLSGQRKTSSHPSSATPIDSTARAQSITSYTGFYHEEEPDFSIPWSLSLSFDYSETKVPPFPLRSSSVRGNLDFSLTENWKFSMSGGYDFLNREVQYPQIQISRDLHCWLMDFTWVPIGTYRHYSFEIRVKASQLHDIKVTKQGSDAGIY